MEYKKKFNSKLNSISAIIVTYNPDVEVIELIVNEVLFQVSNVYIVNNYHVDFNCNRLKVIESKYDIVQVISLDKNYGIGYAQNIGIEKGLSINTSSFVFFDQDSIPDKNMIPALVDVQNNLLGKGIKFSAVGPLSIDRRTNMVSGFVKKDGIKISRINPNSRVKYQEVDFLISSGTLIRSCVIKDVGLFFSDFFIDHVDTEWCFRSIKLGYKIYGCNRAVLYHALGNNVKRIWFLRWRTVPIHSDFRYYFIFRNTMYMVLYTDIPFLWRITLIYRLCMFIIYYLLTMSMSMNLFKNMCIGVFHGVKKKLGEYSFINKRDNI
jgi:rhamnosyltransferase